MTAKDQEFERLDEMENALDLWRAETLSRHGWLYTSDTPDHCWRWTKELSDGTRLMTDQKDALNLERNWL